MQLEVPARHAVSVSQQLWGAVLCCRSWERVGLGDGHGHAFGMQKLSKKSQRCHDECTDASFPCWAITQGSEVENRQQIAQYLYG